MSSSIDGLVPTRFLCLVAHLIVTIMIFWVRDYNVKASLASGYTQEEYTAKDTELIIGLSVALGLFALEFIGFFGGISMFMHSQGLISIAAHCSAAVALTYFLFEQWDIGRYWWVFAFCSCVPGVLEIVVWIAVLGLKRGF
ncbi:transmembrane protein 107-like isoform X1 [Lineus longissimus]|uniref:transmembrane protein 107-like isoform X1 n=1 Tax=Lineus longissimus TaxID=88925 RepID=UPI002B4F5C4B